MSQTLRYCHGCNEKFAVHEDGDSCPRCSQRLSPLATAPTAEVFLTANVQHDSLVEAGIEHDHEEHPGSHFDINDRYGPVIDKLARALTS